MKTVLMAMALVKDGDKVLLRKFDPDRNPYDKPWGSFGGRLEGDGSVVEMLNRELKERWNMTVRITEPLWWDEDKKLDHDEEEKSFIYLYSLCELASGDPHPANPNEGVKWVEVSDLDKYDHVPPQVTFLKRLGYLK